MDIGFWVGSIGIGLAAGLAIFSSIPFSVRFVQTWRLARFMQKLHLGAVPVSGWVAVNGNLENALVMSSREGEVITPGHIPLWMYEEAGETFLRELQEMRMEGAPQNPRLIRVVMFELMDVTEVEEG